MNRGGPFKGAGTLKGRDFFGVYRTPNMTLSALLTVPDQAAGLDFGDLEVIGEKMLQWCPFCGDFKGAGSFLV